MTTEQKMAIPKVTTPADRTVLAAKVAQQLVLETKRYAAGVGIALGAIEVTPSTAVDGEYTFTVENNSGSHHFATDIIDYMVRKTPSMYSSPVEHKEGSFDWASDTYLKDCSVATFSL